MSEGLASRIQFLVRRSSSPDDVIGPLNASSLLALASSGRLTTHDLVTPVGKTDWRYAGRLPRIAAIIRQAERTCGGTQYTTDSDTGSEPGRNVQDQRWDSTVNDADGMDVEVVLPDVIGPFKVISLIGEGGMGSVLLAQQEKPRREVAVKIMRRGLVSEKAMRRFEFESEALGRLQHEGIAHIYRSGVHDDGAGLVPYFAMEYIADAKTLVWFARTESLTQDGRLRLFLKVCDAIAYGHDRGIVHRDLKPANILVNDHGQPKVIDFGVAAGTGDDLAMASMHTDIGKLIGTMQYMSPEQCALEPNSVDARSDVYSMGVVLFELLTGRMPYKVSGLPIPAAIRTIQETPPASLSEFIGPVPPDLEAIVGRALAKSRTDRYQSMGDFAADLRAHLEGGPVSASGRTTRLQFRRFMRRNRMMIAASIVMALMGIAAIVVVLSMQQSFERRTSMLQAELDRLRSGQHSGEVESAQRIAELESAVDRAQSETGRLRQKDRETGYQMLVREAESSRLNGDPDAMRAALDEAHALLEVSERQMPLEWKLLSSGIDASVLPVRSPPVTALAMRSDGGLLAAAAEDGSVRIMRPADGFEIGRATAADLPIVAMLFDEANDVLYTVSKGGLLEHWSWGASGARSIKKVQLWKHLPSGIALNRKWAAIARRGWIRLVSLQTGQVLGGGVLADHDPASGPVAIGESGNVIVSGNGVSSVRPGRLQGEFTSWAVGDAADVISLAVSPDDRLVAAGTVSGDIRLYDTGSGILLRTLKGGDAPLESILFLQDGSSLLSAVRGGPVIVWSTSDWRPLIELAGRGRRAGPVTCDEAQTTVVSGYESLDVSGDRRSIQIWTGQ